MSKPINLIKNILAIASGKGGVGKSTITVNLAHSLAAQGFKVGVLDADIYGPSIPVMMYCRHQEIAYDAQAQMLMPEICANNIKVNSIAFLIKESDAVIWRGPMVSDAVRQLYARTVWGELDFLLIDLPPGTGDIQLTITQKIPVTASILVTTPQLVALTDVKRAFNMFTNPKLNLEVLGVIENMATWMCQHCQAINYTESTNKLVSNFCIEHNLELLGCLPYQPKVQICADAGEALLWRESEFLQLTKNIIQAIQNLKPKKLNFPEIKIEK